MPDGARLPRLGAVLSRQHGAGIANRDSVSGVKEGDGVEGGGGPGIMRGPRGAGVVGAVDEALFAQQVGGGGRGRCRVAQITVLGIGGDGCERQQRSCQGDGTG